MQSDDGVQFYTSSNRWVVLRPSPSAPRKKWRSNIEHCTFYISQKSLFLLFFPLAIPSAPGTKKAKLNIKYQIILLSPQEEKSCTSPYTTATCTLAACHPPRASFDPTYQWEEGGKATHGGSGYCNWWWRAAACSTATAMCGSSPLVAIVINGWRGRRRRTALFCDNWPTFDGWHLVS